MTPLTRLQDDEAFAPDGGTGARPWSGPDQSRRRVFTRLLILYVLGSLAAVVVVMVLGLLGLEFSAPQWLAVATVGPPAIIGYILLDIWIIRRQFQPLGDALSEIDKNASAPDPASLSAGLRCALNMPFKAFLRVTCVHGIAATAAAVLAMTLGNLLLDSQFRPWQFWMFSSTVLLFATPAHAIVEFFAISRMVTPTIRYLTLHGAFLLPGDEAKLVAIRLRAKLGYLAVFVSTLPTIFIAASIIVKLNLLFDDLGIEMSDSHLQPVWLWIGGAVSMAAIGSLAMSLLTASEVSRAAGALVDAMRSVERGQLDVQLTVTGTDEYADIFQGFNLMTTGLRDEVAMLELTHELSGELHIDALIGRIMGATTKLLNADRATLFVHDPKQKELWSRYADGLEITEIRIADSEGIAGEVFQTGATANIGDPYADPRFNPEVDRKTGYRTESILCMPIANKAGVRIAVIQVLNKLRPGGFTAKDETRLRAFAAQIAITLENATLFEEVLTISNYNENILVSSSNGIITLDPEGQIATANTAALAILKLSDAQCLGQPATAIFDGDNHWVLDAIERVNSTGQRDVSVDALLSWTDRGDASVNLTVSPLRNQEDETLGSLLLLEDITNETRVKATMARYMSKEVADQLLADEAQLEGKDQRVTILFSDIRKFTTLSEALGATETVSMLNEYFEDMVEVIFRHNGILDKYIGDAIMALFGAPFVSESDADNAISVANEMISTLYQLNSRRRERGRIMLDIGIGIGTGDVVLGNIGSPKRLEYTAIGDSVNLAARLESATKQYGVPILVSEFTVNDLTQPVKLREIDLMRVKGKDKPVAVYEALDHYTEISFPNMDEATGAFTEGMTAYRNRDFQSARNWFGKALQANRHDGPSQIYLERCAKFLTAPPAGDWDGVWTMTEK